MSTTNVALEVLICTHNRVNLLRRTIHHLNQANRPSDLPVSLCIIANACSDETHQFLHLYQTKADPSMLPLTWLEEPSPGKSNALNRAIPRLTATVIAMVDDDHRVDMHYFQAIHNAISRFPDTDMFCGRIIPDWDGSEPEWVHEQGKYRIYPLPVPHFDFGDQSRSITRDIAVPGGGNLVIKRTLFETVGPFATFLGPVGHNLGGGEDYQWVIRAFETGAKVRYIPEMIQYHYVDAQRLTTRYLIKKAFERSSSVVRASLTEQNYSGTLFPRYLLKKMLVYFLHLILSLNQSARRFYLVRLGASLGEISAYFKPRDSKD